MTPPNPVPLGRPDAILFDWDNTLVDTFPVIRDALNTTLTAFGHEPWSMEKVHAQVRKSVRDRFPALFGDAWKDASDVFYARYNEIHMQKLEQLPNAADMLATLHGDGYYLGVVSNKRGDILRAEAAHLGWDSYFGAIIGANDAARDKPAPEPVSLALAPSGLTTSSSVWFVGDADIDMDCAGNSGCTGILLRQKKPDRNEFRDGQIAHYFADGMALCKFVQNL